MHIKQAITFNISTLLLIILLSCENQNPAEIRDLSESDKKAITDSIVSVMNNYANTQNNLEYSNIPEEYYLNHPDFKTYLDGKIYNYADMENTVKELEQVMKQSKVVWDTIVVTPININSALATAPFIRTDVDSAGNSTKAWGVANWLWVRHKGGWKAIYGQGNHYPDTAFYNEIY